MTVVGITGPTGAGKTTVLQVVEELGGVVVDCDQVYHQLTCTCQPMLEQLRERFGAEIFDPSGALVRKRLGQAVFDDPQALEDLNRITHRHVVAEVERRLAKAEQAGVSLAAVDAIALLESGLGRLCQATVAVSAPQEVRLCRIMAREGISEAYARLRVSAQKPECYFEQRCDHVLHNDGDDPQALRAQARTLLAQLIET